MAREFEVQRGEKFEFGREETLVTTGRDGNGG